MGKSRKMELEKKEDVPKQDEIGHSEEFESKEKDDREALYEKYNEFTFLDAFTEDESKNEKESQEQIPEQATGIEPEKESQEQVEEPEKESSNSGKFVPLSALHEEREKRKALRKELEALKEQLNTFQSQHVKQDDNETKKEDDDNDFVFKKEFKELQKKELGELKYKIQRIEEMAKHEKENKFKNEMQKLITDVDDDLSKEGYVGFAKLEQEVANVINAKLQDAEDEFEKAEILKTLHTPSGWKKIYKEIIFPEYSKLFIKSHKEEIVRNKDEKKRDANLAGSHGGSVQSSAMDDDDDDDKGTTDAERYKKYVKFRKAQMSF